MSSPTDERRRSSGTFANLMSHKRNPSNEAATARRLSTSEQNIGKPGIIGSMWNSFTRGHPTNSTSTSTSTTAAAKPPAPAKQSIHRTGAGTLG